MRDYYHSARIRFCRRMTLAAVITYGFLALTFPKLPMPQAHPDDNATHCTPCVGIRGHKPPEHAKLTDIV